MERCCASYAARGQGTHVGDALHAFFQCGRGAVQEQRWGWKEPPGGAADLGQLSNGELKKAVAFVADIENVLAATT